MKSTHFIVIAGLLLAEASLAQTATTAASVIIDNRLIAITKTGDLNFGTIVPSLDIAGTASVSIGHVVTVNNVVASSTTLARAATYSVTGNPLAEYNVTLPSSITLSNGAQTMTVNQFVRSGGVAALTMNTSGISSFNVGATLNVNANQASGTYTGNFDVTVAYN